MKKLFACALVALSMTAYAETWVTVVDSDDNETRLQMAKETFRVNKDGDTLFIGAAFRVIQNAEPGEPSFFIITADTCIEDGGKMLQRKWNGKEWYNVKMWYWSDSGEKLFDAIGRKLCDIAKTGTKPKGKKDDI